MTKSPVAPMRASSIVRFLSDQRNWAPYLLVAPFFITFALFTLYPLLRAIQMTFQRNVALTNRWEWVGLANLAEALQDGELGIALRNFIFYVAGSLMTQIPIAFLLAVVLSSPFLSGRGFFRTVYFIPSLLPGIAMGIVGLWFFDERRGLANALWLAVGGQERIAWGALPAHIMPMLLTIAFWQWMGQHAVYLLAGMVGIEPDLLEAAMVDGANAWQRARYIILPLLRPVFAFLLITTSLGSLMLYDVPTILGEAEGGADGQGWFFLPYISYLAFDQSRMGYATAVGWLVFLLAVTITFFQLKLYNFGEIE